MSQTNPPGDGSILAVWQEQLKTAARNLFLFQLLLKQMRYVLKRLAYFYAQLESLPRRNRRALQRALATSLVGAAMLLALSSAPVVHAVSMTVDGTGLADDGRCSLVEAIYNSNSDSQVYVTAGECPAGTGADTIILPSSGTFDYATHYTPSFALPVVTSDITINANGSTISRNSGAADDFGVLGVSDVSGSSLTLNDATVSGATPVGSGFYYGGGISNLGGTLVVNNCTVTGNAAYIGGGVFALYGTTHVNDSIIAENFAFGGGGLAIANGTLTVDNTTVGGNYAIYGGGILNASGGEYLIPQTSNLTVTNSTVTYNYAIAEGGGIWTVGYYDPTPIAPPKPEGGSAQGSASPKLFEAFLRARGENLNLQDIKSKLGTGALKRSHASGNVTTRPPAGRDDDATTKRDGTKRARQAKPKPEAINANTYAITHINDSTIDHNTAYTYGGGIATNYYTRTYISNTLITYNSAGEGGGVHTYFGEVSMENSTISYNQATYEDGGGLRNDAGIVTVIGSTVTGNSAVDDGGGLNNRGEGTMFVTNSTLSGNIADSDTTATGDGGGFRNVTGSIATLANVTIVNNSAAFGGGVANEEVFVTLQRTLVSGNTATVLGNEVANWDTLNADDFNLFGHDGEINAQAFYGFVPGGTDITATSDGTNSTALAAILSTTLANNGSFITTPGGVVQTLALLVGSPAIDAAPNAECAAPPVNGRDQRNFVRPAGTSCDIGAFEFGATTVVNVTGVRGGVNKNGDAVIKWRTASEAQIAGFNVYRQGKQGAWKQINAKFKSAKHAGATLGDKYRMTDKNVKPDQTYRYKIEIRYLDGQTEWSRVISVHTPSAR